MVSAEELKKAIEDGYAFQGQSSVFGTAIYTNTPIEKAQVKIPLSVVNRHGVIA